MTCAIRHFRFTFSVAPFLLLIASTCGTAHATCVVILRSARRIYIGADSRRSYRETGGTYNGSVCKIIPAGRLFFVASGLTYANDEQVATLGAEVGRNAASVRSAIEEFRRRMQQFLPQAIAAEGRVEHTVRNGLILEAAFAGIEDNTSRVSAEWYRTNGSSAAPRVASDRRTYSSSASGRYDCIILGKRRAIDHDLNGRMPPVRNDSDAVGLIKRLITLEISESPESTAVPIDILEVDGSGSRWLQRKPGCETAPHPS